MATCSTAVVMGPCERQIPKQDGDNVNTSSSGGVATAVASENGNGNGDPADPGHHHRCFVCDVKVQGRHYALATCRTQSSRSRVIEKLGELVGERYMVVISEDDVICRGCANLMNTLDRLESEMRGVRDAILRFLERKYSLDEGELLGNSDAVKPCQPPQITKSQSQNGGGYHARKRAAVFSSEAPSDGGKHKKSNVWMQCDKCRYTTRYNAFMVHHIRQHIKQRATCDKCGVQLTAQQQTLHLCQRKNETSIAPEEASVKEKEPPIEMETVETSCPNKVETLTTMSMPSDSQSQNVVCTKEENVQLIRLANTDDLQLQSIITSADNRRPGQPVYVRVLQHVAVDEGGSNSTAEMGTESSDVVVKVKEGPGKQMLTLAEDGSLEMVEVACWDDVHPPDPDPDIPF